MVSPLVTPRSRDVFGAPVLRKEDARLLVGRGRYVSDVALPRMVHAAFARSPHAHARLHAVDTTAAASVPGVVAVLTGNDSLVSHHRLRARSALPTYVETSQPLLAWPTVRYSGEAVAVVVALDRYTAEDATELVQIHGEPLPVTVDARDARTVLVHEEAPGNVLLSRRFEHGDVDAALAVAAVVI